MHLFSIGVQVYLRAAADSSVNVSQAVNVEYPKTLPESIYAWKSAKWHILIWLSASVLVLVLLAMTLVSALGPIVAIVACSLYLCPWRNNNNLPANARTILMCSITVFLLDFFFALRLILIGAAFGADGGKDWLFWLIPGLSLFLHSCFSMAVFRKMTEVSVRVTPLTAPIVNIS